MKGFTIIEILVAITVLGLISTGFFTLFNFSLRANSQNEKEIEALNLAKENLEIIRALRNESWNYLTNLTMGANYYPIKNESGQWALIQGIENKNGFNKSIIVENVERDASDNIVASGGTNDLNTKKITSIVSWTDKNIILTAYLTNWK